MNCFSQNDTVKLSEQTARLTIKDLVEGDFCKQENENLTTQNNILISQLDTKQSEINILDATVEALKSIVVLKDEMINNDQGVIKDLNKIITKKDNVSLIYKIGTGVGIVLGLILIAQ